MKFKIIILSVLALTFFNCNSSGGSYLGEGENKGKSYSFGDAAATKTILAIAEAYTNQDAAQMSKQYEPTFLGDNGEAGSDKWLFLMNSISMKPYNILLMYMNHEQAQQVYL